MVFEDHALELLQRGESEYQKAIDSYNNYEILCSESSSYSSPSASKSQCNGDGDDDEGGGGGESSGGGSILNAKQLRQFIEENLRSHDVSERMEDHGKRFLGNDDDYFESSATATTGDGAASSEMGGGGENYRRKRSRSNATSSERMGSGSSECGGESHYDEEDVREVYVYYDEEDSAPMEVMNEEETREFGGDDEVSYDAEFTDVTYM